MKSPKGIPPRPSGPVLVLIRHAKSAWDEESLADHARPLAPRGRRDAPRMGEVLARSGWLPDRVRASDATRAWQTWEGMRNGIRRVDEGRALPEVELDPSLYGIEAAALQEQVPELLGEEGCVWLIGHNPAWEELVEALSGVEARMPTGAAALLVPRADRYQLLDVVRPKELEDRGLWRESGKKGQ